MTKADNFSRYADMFAAIGAEPRLRIMRLLLTAHPEGLVVGELQSGLGIAASTLSHHLEKLKIENLVTVSRHGTFLRYRANTDTLRDLLGFLYTECCSLSARLVAFASGSLMGGAFFHPIPEAVVRQGDAAFGMVVFGLVFFF